MARPPLNRPMFRVPGMSRQPMGILASGPEIMNAAMRSTDQNPFMMGANPVRVRQVSTAPVVEAQAPVVGETTDRMSQMDRDIMGSLSAADMEAMLARQFQAAGPAEEAAPAEAPASTADIITRSLRDRLAPDADADKPSRTKTYADQLRDNINKYYRATESKKPPSLDDPITALGGKSYNALVNELVNKEGEELPKMSDYKLSDFHDLAMEASGMKKAPKDVADEDRQVAFWLNLMKAGLAIASGESPDALTNIAKGLSFGLESYGKDMNQISDREREDNKDLAKVKFALLKDQKDSDLAQRAASIQALQTKVAIADRLTKDELAQFEKMQDRALMSLKLENDFITNVNKYDLDLEKLQFDKTKFQQTLNATLAGQTPAFIRELAAAGYVEPTDSRKPINFGNPNSYKLTEDGQNLFKAYVESKGQTRITELMSAADAAAEVQTVDMLSFGHLPEAEAKQKARQVALVVGKMRLPSDAENRANALLGVAQSTGARSSAPEMIDYVIENSVPGVDYYNAAGQKVELPQGTSLSSLQLQDRADFRSKVAYVQFKPVGSRTLATPE